MLASTCLILRWANFLQRGPTGASFRKPLRKILISAKVKPMSLAKRMSSRRLRASLGVAPLIALTVGCRDDAQLLVITDGGSPKTGICG